MSLDSSLPQERTQFEDACGRKNRPNNNNDNNDNNNKGGRRKKKNSRRKKYHFLVSPKKGEPYQQ